MDKHSTIAAIATPIGRGGIGIIRVSGDNALDISLGLFVFPGGKKPGIILSHHVYYGHIIDQSGRIVDEVLFIYMKSPRSYTAEDVVEIQSHSSPIVLRKILDLFLKNGAEIAEPGEFTKRAYLNGRIDLTQAEAVIDIINARTSTSLDLAVSQIKGDLKHEILAIRESLVTLYSRIEAIIDFPDDVGDIGNEDESLDILKVHVLERLARLRQGFDDFNVFRDGIRIVIVGPPNSGKSSLLNALLNKEKSIVTPIPGTTRDLIDDIINIEGIPFEITDTAGIQETDDQVEKIGIQRTFDKLKEADLIILMLDATSDLNDQEKDKLQSIYNEYNETKKVVVIENKIDRITEALKHREFMKPDIRMSVIKRMGLEELKQKISDIMIADMPENRNSIVPNVRHYRLIEQCIHGVTDIIQGIMAGVTYDLIAVDVKAALDVLGEILGSDARFDVLDRIFSTFCIGK
jgi:tRNA modification GTPase